MPSQPPVFSLPLPLEDLGMTPFGGLLLLLSLVVGALTSIYVLRAPGGRVHLTLVVLFLTVAVPLFTVDNVLFFFLLWFVASLVAWGIGQNALGESREGTAVLFLQLAGWVAVAAVGVCFVLLHVNSANTFSLSAMRPEGADWVGHVLLVALLLMTSALLGCAWRGGNQPLTAGAGAFLLTAGAFVMGVYPFYKLVLGIFGPLMEWRELALWIGLLGAMALALAALGEDDVRRVLSYVSFAQLLLLFAGLALPNRQGLTGVVLVLIVYTFSCTALFLALGTAVQRVDEQRLSVLGGLASLSPGGAVLFAVAGLALAGLPPLGAFLGQVMLATFLLRLGSLWPAVAYGAAWALIVFALLRLFAGVYLGPVSASVLHGAETSPRRLATFALAPLVLAVFLAALVPLWGAGIVEPVVTSLLR